MMIHGSKYSVPITLQQSQPVYVYSCPYRGKTYCEQGILRVSIVAQKIALADLGAFFAQSCYHTKSVMDVKLEMIENYLKDCIISRISVTKSNFFSTTLVCQIL